LPEPDSIPEHTLDSFVLEHKKWREDAYIVISENKFITSWFITSARTIDDYTIDYSNKYDVMTYKEYFELIKVKAFVIDANDFIGVNLSVCNMCWNPDIKPEQIVCDKCEHLLNWLPNLKPNM
jgi:hypothetical protein